MNKQEWIEAAGSLTAAPYKAFEKAECPITGNLEQLDPVCGFSLDGMAATVRRGELEPPLGWGLNPAVGFETRFHAKKLSNITFRTLHEGFTKGSMLVNLSDDELWMRNLDNRSGVVELGGDQYPTRNLWRDFLLATVWHIEPIYQPPTAEDYEWYNFTAKVLVHSVYTSVRPATIAGCVIDVPNFSEEGPAELPCEIPITFRDLDYLRTNELLDGSLVPAGEQFSWLLENFFGSDGKPTACARLLEHGAGLPEEDLRRYTEAGHGFLGMLKGERERFGVEVSIPQLELRDAARVPSS